VLALPPVVTTINVPDFFSPSALGGSGGCALRLISSPTFRNTSMERLIQGPGAALGTFIHRVFERVARGAAGASPEEVFDAEYERITEELRKDPRDNTLPTLPRPRRLRNGRNFEHGF
jgi:hypothetical protein